MKNAHKILAGVMSGLTVLATHQKVDAAVSIQRFNTSNIQQVSSVSSLQFKDVRTNDTGASSSSLTSKPSATPTIKPTAKPTIKPTAKPSIKPSAKPTAKPSPKPIVKMSPKPSIKPSPKATPKITPKASGSSYGFLQTVKDLFRGFFGK